MLEMKITITAADLAVAINNLAAALAGKALKPVVKEGAPVGSAPVAQPTIGAIPVNPTVAPVASPAQTTGAPLSATPVQTATPIAPTVPVAVPAPAVTPVANAVPTGAVPTATPQYTIDMLATAGSSLIDAGKMDQLLQVLAKHGVASLTNIKPENYGAVATDLRALGAAI